MGISTFFGLNIGVNALDALQEAQGIVSNNIANASTPGYVQESANFGEETPFPPANETSIPGQIGQGAVVTSVQRSVDAFLDHQDRVNQSVSQMYDTQNSVLTEIQSILNEPSSNSIQAATDQFFSAWQTLSSSPSSTAARQSVITQAQTLSQTFSTVTNQLEQLQGNLQGVVSGAVTPTNLSGYSDSPGMGTFAGTATGLAQSQPPVAIVSGTAQLQSTPTYPEDRFQVQVTAQGQSTGTGYSVQLVDATTQTLVGPAVTVSGPAGTLTIGSPTGVQFSVSLTNLTSLYSGTLASGTTYVQSDDLTPPLPGGQVAEMNNYAAQLLNLNQQIRDVVQNGQSPNTLLDQQGRTLDEMAKIANIKYTTDSNGVVSVTLGAVQLVNGASRTNPITYSDMAHMADVTQDASTWAIQSGSMAGNLRGMQDASNLLGQMDSFLTTLATTVNSIQTTGYPLQGSTKAPALLQSSLDAAGHVVLSVPATLTAGDIAASSQPDQPGNNENALQMVGLQSQLVYNGGTLDQGLGQMISQVGIEAGAVQDSQKTSSALAQQSTTLRQSVSGVDINQQAALMVQYQNSYNAAAKYISVFNQMLQTLINMVPA